MGGSCNETYAFAGSVLCSVGEVMQNVRGDVFCSKKNEGTVIRLWGLFRNFLTRLRER